MVTIIVSFTNHGKVLPSNLVFTLVMADVVANPWNCTFRLRECAKGFNLRNVGDGWCAGLLLVWRNVEETAGIID